MFLLDTSLSENPDLFAAHVVLLQQILKRNEARIKRFNVLLFDVGARWSSAKAWMTNNQDTRTKLLTQLKKIVLEGATDMNAALKQLARPSWKVDGSQPVDVFFLSDGQLNWGETNFDAMLGQFKRLSVWKSVRFFSYYLGIGSENVSLFQRLVRQGGAVFSCLGKAELPRCAVAHTRSAMLLKNVKVDGVGASETLIAGRQTSVYPGGMIALASRYAKDGVAKLTLQGTLDGKPKTNQI